MDYITLIGLTVAVIAAGSTGAMFPPDEWYKTIRKPSWTPPNWLFPIAWTVLYATMIWAAWRVSKVEIALAGPTFVGPALAMFAAQIALNAIWSPIFFGANRIGVALAVIVALWLAVAAMLFLFLRADTVAGLVTIPYLIWVSYAGALNAWIWRENSSGADTARAP